MKTNFGLVHNEWIFLTKKNEGMINILYILDFIPAVLLYFLIRAFYSDVVLHPIRFFLDNMPLCLVIWNFLFIKTWVIETSLLVISALSKDTKEELSFKKKLDYVIKRFIPLIITTYAYTIIVIVGLLLFIIPGLIFMAKYSQAFNFVLISGEKPLDAFRKSASMTKGHYLGILWLYFMFTFVFSFGFFGIPLVDYVLWKMSQLGSSYIPTPVPAATPISKVGKMIVYPIILILIVVILSTFYQLYRVGETKKNDTTTAKKVLLQPTPTPTRKVQTATQSGQIYTNNKYGYSLKYPLEFVVQSLLTTEPDSSASSNVAIRTIDGTKYITITVGSGDIDEVVRASQKSNKLDLLQTTDRAGHTIVILGNDKVGAANLQTKAFVEINSKQYLEIRLGPTPKGEKMEYREFFLQILSTLAFF